MARRNVAWLDRLVRHEQGTASGMASAKAGTNQHCRGSRNQLRRAHGMAWLGLAW